MNVLFLIAPISLHPWYDDLLTAINGEHRVELYDPAKPMAAQVSDVGVVVDMLGCTHEMVDAALAANVKLWQLVSTGLDHWDIRYFLDKGMPVANTPGQFSAVALAEHAIFLMLSLAKNYTAGQKNLRSQIFFEPMSDELDGKTLGLVGLGASGRALAGRAYAMGMRVMALDTADVPQSVRDELHIDFFGGPDQLDRIFTEADYISIHVPLTPQTRHLIGRRAFDQMKPTARLINVARGEIVDEAALVEALQSGRIMGAGLDVFAHEPLDPAHPLLQMDNVICTPHVAGRARITSRQRTQAAATNISRIAGGLPPLFQITSLD